MMPRPAALLIIAALSVAACGGGGAPPGSAASSGASTPADGGYGGGYGTDTPSVAPVATAPPSEPAVGGAVAAVSIVDYAFAPADLTVAAGTTVTWTNTDRRPHTVKSADGAFASSATLGTGDAYAVTFEEAGTFPYVCAFHPVMTGAVTVTP